MVDSQRSYDAIVIGGGHNGLVNGAYLARAGLRTLVLERRPILGGAAITEELRPGFRFTTFSYALGPFRPQVVAELNLVAHGFRPLPMPATLCPIDGHDALVLGPDPVANRAEIARHDPADAEAYPRYRADLARVCAAVLPLFDQAPPDLFDPSPEARAELADLARHLGGLEPRVLHDLVRLLTGSAADFLDAYFRSDIVKGWLASSGVIGSRMGPLSPGSGLVLLYLSLGRADDGSFGHWAFHQGGNGGLTGVLARAAGALGAEIRPGAEVERVLTTNGRATGVALTDGTELSAPVVVSAADPHRTFTRFVDPGELPDDLTDSLRRYRYRGVASKVNYALSGLPHHPAVAGRPEAFRGFVNIAPTLEYLERAFDQAKYGWWSPRPYIDACVQSTIDPTMAPPGGHVLSCFVQYTPHELKGSDWGREAGPMADAVTDTLESHFSGFADLVLQREVVTPDRIEAEAGLPGGDIYAGELSASQLWWFRPAPGWSRYRTPIAGYYQCGSGTHPGGCVTGGPGRLASQRILADLARHDG